MPWVYMRVTWDTKLYCYSLAQNNCPLISVWPQIKASKFIPYLCY